MAPCRKIKTAICIAVSACVLSLAGCGGVPDGIPDDMFHIQEGAAQGGSVMPQERRDGYSPDAGSASVQAPDGYELDVQAGTDVLEGILSGYDQDTKIEVDASAEKEAFGSAHEGRSPEFVMTEGAPDGSVDVPEEPVAAAPLPLVLKPEAPGICEMSNECCTIDYSYANDGYFMVRWTAGAAKVKVQTTGASGITYTYDLYSGQWAALPFSDGNGTYAVRVLQNVGGTKYAVVGSLDISVELVDEFAPFLRPNQYVNYEDAASVTAQASECCRGASDELEKVAGVYDWVVSSIAYDYEKAATVQSGYLPDLEQVYADRQGICFDYAALMAGMLRSQGVACRLVIGYAGNAYHAWISVYVPGTGWVDGVIFFDGTSWQRMDPTFAAGSGGDPAILEYIGDGSNYSARYLY